MCGLGSGPNSALGNRRRSRTWSRRAEISPATQIFHGCLGRPGGAGKFGLGPKVIDRKGMQGFSRIRHALPLAALVGAATLASPALAETPGDSFSRPMFGDRSEALWPLEVGLEIVVHESNPAGLSASGRGQGPASHTRIVVPRRALVVSDGQHTTFTEVIATPSGQRVFEIEVVARHHDGRKVELEYDLIVRQARFAELTWSDYVLHRLSLAPRPELGPQVLAAARADIVETKGEVHSQRVRVDGDLYEVRLHAHSMRG